MRGPFHFLKPLICRAVSLQGKGCEPNLIESLKLRKSRLCLLFLIPIIWLTAAFSGAN